MVKPFFKWPGSKVWLVDKISKYLTDFDNSRVVEPFAGSAAFFFGSSGSQALLADANSCIVDCLSAVRNNPDEVIRYLATLSNSREVYYVMRDFEPSDPYMVAARMIYLTNTSWGGLYRENKKGKFNVPFGDNGRDFYSSEAIYRASHKLKDTVVAHGDYSVTLTKVRKDDLVFIDAPYVTRKHAEFFDRYHASRFCWADQVALSNELVKKARQNIKVIVTCAADPHLYELFPGWHIFEFNKSNSMIIKNARTYRKEALVLSPGLKDVAHRLLSNNVGERVE